MSIIDKLSKLADDPIKLGLSIFLIFAMTGAVSEVWKLYEKRQQEERGRQVCEQMKQVREVVIQRMKAGLPVEGGDAAAAYQIGVMTSRGCEPEK